MTEQEILIKAIVKAQNNGWQGGHWLKVFKVNNFIDVPVKEIIYNHDFAKALWGETEVEWHYQGDGSPIKYKLWEKHLELMVIADDPIKYLGENL